MDSAWTLMFYSAPWYISPIAFPPSISSFIIEIAFAIIWATGTRLAFAMFRSGTTSVRTSEIGKYPDGILPQHGLWTMDYG